MNNLWDIALFLISLSITMSGFFYIFFFDLNDFVRIDMEGNLALVPFIFSITFVGIAFYQKNKREQYTKKLRFLLMVATAIEPGLLGKVKQWQLDKFTPDINLPFSLIVEKFGRSNGYVQVRGAGDWLAAMNSFFNLEDNTGKNYEIIEDIIELLEKACGDIGRDFGIHWNRVYYDLKLLDKIILESLPDDLKEKYPKKVYFSRLNLLEMVFPKLVKDEIFIIQEDDGKNIVRDYFKYILDAFYLHPEHIRHEEYKRKYEKQSTRFSMENYRKSIEKEDI
jgi:hypothetical protein